MAEGTTTEKPLIGDEPRALTLGERRVRLGFNPSGHETVDRIKRIAADAIDLCEQLKLDARTGRPTDDPFPGERLRLYALAQTAFEEAAMWAVKAATG